MDARAEAVTGGLSVHDRTVLDSYGLRWAVLAAWADQLATRRVALPTRVRAKQEEARIKISSGCYSPCEVGCVLSEVEAELVAADSSTRDPRAGFWIELLGMTMSDHSITEQLLRIPAVQVHYSDCGLPSCRC